jgi:Kef-type K+ transport system membrane component KefB
MLSAVVAIARSPSSAIAVVTELQADGPFTQTMLGVTMVTDVVVILLFTAAAKLGETMLDPTLTPSLTPILTPILTLTPTLTPTQPQTLS